MQGCIALSASSPWRHLLGGCGNHCLLQQLSVLNPAVVGWGQVLVSRSPPGDRAAGGWGLHPTSIPGHCVRLCLRAVLVKPSGPLQRTGRIWPAAFRASSRSLWTRTLLRGEGRQQTSSRTWLWLTHLKSITLNISHMTQAAKGTLRLREIHGRLWSVDASLTVNQAKILTPLPRLLIVSVLFVVKKSPELGITLQGPLQKSLSVSVSAGWHVSLLLQNSFILLLGLSELGQGQSSSHLLFASFLLPHPRV